MALAGTLWTCASGKPSYPDDKGLQTDGVCLRVGFGLSVGSRHDLSPCVRPRSGTVSRIGGMSLADLQREAESLWAKGFPEKAMTKLEDYGFIQSRTKGETGAMVMFCCMAIE